MTPELIIGIVSAIIGVGVVKIWLYKIFKFKMDEGIVLQFFEENKSSGSHSIVAIAKGAELPEERVNKVCNKSSAFKLVDEETDEWGLVK